MVSKNHFINIILMKTIFIGCVTGVPVPAPQEKVAVLEKNTTQVHIPISFYIALYVCDCQYIFYITATTQWYCAEDYCSSGNVQT